MTTIAHFSEIKNVIIKELKKAKYSIYIAVPWFTDFDLFSSLINRAKEGISVRLILLKDNINVESRINYLELTEINNNCKVWLIEGTFHKNESIMHNKFCIIDSNVVINGSFNWTLKANINQESITIHRDDLNLSQAFQNQFSNLINTYFGIHDINYINYKRLWLIINNLKNSIIASDLINTEKLLVDLTNLSESFQEPLKKEIDSITKSIKKENYVYVLRSVFQINNILSKEAMSLYYSASTEFEDRNFGRALSLLEEALEIYPNSEASLQKIAEIYAIQKQEEFAINYYSIAKATNQHSLKALQNENNYGIHLTISEETISKIKDTNLEIYQNYYFNNPNSFQGHIEYALILIEHGQLNTAEKVLKGALLLDKYNILPLKLLGEIYNQLKRYEDSIELLQKYTAIENNDDEASYYLGHSLYMLNKYEEASSYLEKATLNEKMNVNAFCILADCYFNMNELIKANNYLDDVLKTNTKNEFANQLRKKWKKKKSN